MVKMKRIIGLITVFLVLLGTFAFTACNNNKDDPNKTVEYSFNISKTEMSLEVGESEKLECRYGDKKIVFVSSNESVASVAEDGTVSGVSAGVAYVTVKAEGVDGAEKICKVTVIKNVYGVEFDRSGEITAVLNGGSVTLDFVATVYVNGEKSDLTATFSVAPEGCALKAEGNAARVTFSAVGEYELTASYKNASAKITVKVTDSIAD